ncbi:MAG: hypothetical protein KJ606_12410, partial [Chloroflexi bacterium]|nr:hypothetical protein [Chloroflexota bacterium]
QVRVVPGVKNVLNRAQNLRQRFRIKFRRSTSARRKAGQPYLAAGGFGWLHICSLIVLPPDICIERANLLEPRRNEDPEGRLVVQNK